MNGDQTWRPVYHRGEGMTYRQVDGYLQSLSECAGGQVWRTGTYRAETAITCTYPVQASLHQVVRSHTTGIAAIGRFTRPTRRRSGKGK